MRTMAAAVLILLTACGPTNKVVPAPESTHGPLGVSVQPILHGFYGVTTDNNYADCFRQKDYKPCENTKDPESRLVEFASNYCAKAGKAIDAEG